MIRVTFVKNSTDEQKVARKENAIGIFDFADRQLPHSAKRLFYISTTSVKDLEQVAANLEWECFPAAGNFKRFSVETSKSELIEIILNEFTDVLFTKTI